MNEPAVTDSTCLIGLERIGRLDLLPALFIGVGAAGSASGIWAKICVAEDTETSRVASTTAMEGCG